MNLNAINWKSFLLKDLYKIKMGDKLDKNKMSYDLPSVNFVSRISYNNGVDTRVDKLLSKEPNPAGLLTVALGGEYLGSCYIQKEPFYTAQNVAILEPRFIEMTDAVNLFISSLVKYECRTKYYAFGRELNTHINKDFTINLPVKYNQQGNPLIDNKKKYCLEGFIPDWEYMDKYIRFLRSYPLTTNNTNISLPLNFENWKSFSLSKIMRIYNGKGITAEEIELFPGELAAVQSGEDNNGVIGYIDQSYCAENNYTYCTKPCLTVARTGSAGFVSFQKCGCVVGDSAKLLLLENEHATIECYLFVQTLLLMNKFKYDYGRKVTENKYLNETILLPVLHENGLPVIDETCKYSEQGYVPDWSFMEKYMRSLPYGDRL